MSWHNPQTQQVRWLDALNTGSTEIPGFAVVYINSAGLASEYGITLPDDPYVLETVQFFDAAATVEHSVETLGTYGPACEIRDRYHDVMGYFAVNSSVPIPPGRSGKVTCDPPFVVLSDSTGLPLVPKSGAWHLTKALPSDAFCGGGYIFYEWFRCLLDNIQTPDTNNVRPMLVDIDSIHFTGVDPVTGAFP